MNKKGKAATKWLKAKPSLMPRSILRADGSVCYRPISVDVQQRLQAEMDAPPQQGPCNQ